MRFHMSLILTGVAMMVCIFAWPSHSCPDYACSDSHFYGNEDLLLWDPEHQAPTLEYSEPVAVAEKPRLAVGMGGQLRSEGRPGWHYTDAQFVPDLDGDGHRDLALVSLLGSGRCATSAHWNTRGEVELVSIAKRRTIGTHSGDFLFGMRTSAAGDVLLAHQTFFFREGGLRMFDSPCAAPRWEAESVWDEYVFVGDVDGDGVEDVAVAHPRALAMLDGVRRHLGRVELLSGADGAMLWGRNGTERKADLGRKLLRAGDRDGDGVPDVAAFTQDEVKIHSGRDGVLLATERVPAELKDADVEPVVDLDGDGISEYLFTDLDATTGPTLAIRSAGSWEPLDVADGWRVLWITRGDLDDDGEDELILGRMDPESKERRISAYSRLGLRDLRTVGDDESDWHDVRATGAGRLREGGEWRALLLHEGRSRSMTAADALDLVPLR